MRINTNLVELASDDSQQMLDFICDNFIQLKSFYFNVKIIKSLSKLNKLINLENLNLRVTVIRFSLMDENYCFNTTLKSLNFTSSFRNTVRINALNMNSE